MGWLHQVSLSWFQIFCIRIIQCGRIPRHVAFIMDGNRRYAVKKRIAKVEGHKSGFEKMSETLQWCIHLGIAEATVYAFSVENFNRSEEEVNVLMNLARDNFSNLLAEEDNIMANGVKIRVIGNVDMLPEDIQEQVAKVTNLTKDNNRTFLNIAVAYTSRLEIATAIGHVVGAIEDHVLHPDNISERLLSKCMYTSETPDPDLLIRTSGALRFSDFLLWQISATCVYFTEQLWPEFGFWNLMLSLLYYQRHLRKLEALIDRQTMYCNVSCFGGTGEREAEFFEGVEKARWKKLEKYLPPKQVVEKLD